MFTDEHRFGWMRDIRLGKYSRPAMTSIVLHFFHTFVNSQSFKRITELLKGGGEILFLKLSLATTINKRLGLLLGNNNKKKTYCERTQTISKNVYNNDFPHHGNLFFFLSTSLLFYYKSA